MGSIVLFDAVHSRIGFSVWNIRGNYYIASGYETFSKTIQRVHYDGSSLTSKLVTKSNNKFYFRASAYLAVHSPWSLQTDLVATSSS